MNWRPDPIEVEDEVPSPPSIWRAYWSLSWNLGPPKVHSSNLENWLAFLSKIASPSGSYGGVRRTKEPLEDLCEN